jgi:hypothetical protein
VSEERDHFVFGPRDRRGLIAGARAGQLVLVAAGFVLALASLHLVRGPARVPTAMTFIVASLASVTWPIGGRTVEEWVPVVLAFSTKSIVRANRSVIGVALSTRDARKRSVFDGFEIAEVSPKSTPPFGVLVDRRSSTATALVELGGEAYALLSESERLRRVEGWAGVLASVARDAGAIHRLQWIERTVPDVSDAMRTHLERSLDASSQTRPHPNALRSYRELLASETSVALVHECFVAVSVRTPKGGAVTREERGQAHSPSSERLSEEIILLAERCHHAGVPVRGVLSRVGLESMIRRSFDAVAALTPPSSPWPVAVETTWAAIRADGLWHATFWVAEWPRHEVGSDFLLPLLVGTRGRRTISLVMAPIPPLRAVRRAEHARTSRVADAELRRRHGFANTARARSEDESVVRREEELAAGHAAFRFSAYVTVSSPERDVLERSCRDVVHAAALSGLDLRRLYGDQAVALCFTLPTGRGRS